MIKLETEYGTYEADTMQEVRKLASKGKAKAARAAQEREANYKRAREKAGAQAFQILARKVKGEEFPRAWTFFSNANRNGPVKELPREHSWQCKLEIETPDSERGTYDFSYHAFLGSVCNGSGFAIAIILQDTYRGVSGGARSVFAVGVHNGAVAIEEIPTVTIEDFHPSRHN